MRFLSTQALHTWQSQLLECTMHVASWALPVASRVMQCIDTASIRGLSAV